MLSQLTGQEPGLAGLWNFDDPANPGRDVTGHGHDGKLVGNATVAGATFPRPTPPAALDVVLQLDGTNSFVELPPDIFTNLTEATVEGWVKWQAFSSYSRFFDFGKARQDISVNQDATRPNLRFEVNTGPDRQAVVTVSDVLKLNEWVHIAAVSGPGGMKLYVNGMLRAENPSTNSFKEVANGEHNYLGRSNWKVIEPALNDDLKGQMDEVRVWSVARSEDEIRESMFRPLTGQEPGLVGLWNFDDPANPGRDASSSGYHGKLVGNARVVEGAKPVRTSANLANVLEMDGQTGTLELSERFANISDNFTIELWARPTLGRTMSDPGPIAGMTGQRYAFLPTQGTLGLGGNPHAGVSLSLGNNSIAVVEHAENYLPVVVEAPRTIDDWIHVAVVYRDKKPSLYLDGSLAATGPQSQRIVHPSFGNPEFKGGINVGMNAYAGLLDDIRVWSVARTEAEIRENMARRLTGLEPGLAGILDFQWRRERVREGPHGGSARPETCRRGQSGQPKPATGCTTRSPSG